MANSRPPITTVDIGTNTLQAVTGWALPDGTIHTLHDEEAITRLGQGVDRAHYLLPAAMERALGALEAMVDNARNVGTTAIHAVATSAVRDAANRDEFLARAQGITRGPVRVITGVEEAQLTFAGARHGTSLGPGTRALVFDVGGGSTELVVGQLDEPPSWCRSVNVGSVRGYERWFADDPPREPALAAVRAELRAALPAEIPSHEVLLGVAATVATLAAVCEAFEPGSSHGQAFLPRATALQAIERLIRLPLAQRRVLRGVPVGRAEVIVAGACIVAAVLEASPAAALHVSRGGVRHGLLRTLSLWKG